MSKLFFYILLFSGFFFSFSQSVWELEKDELGIQVYTRAVKTSSIKEYRATTIVKASIKSLVNKIIDGDHLKQWNYKTITSELIEKKNKNKYIIYMYNNLPWPAKDRDHISELEVIAVSDSLTKVVIKSDAKRIPEKKGVIRVVEFSGHWILEKTKEGVKVTQQMYGDPGGYLPVFVVNSMLVNAPFYTFKQLKMQLNH